MKTSLIYGVVIAVANAIISLTSFLLGFQTTKFGQGAWIGLLAFIVPLVILYIGMREAREAYPNKATEGFPYSKAVMASLTITTFAGLFTAVYVFIHTTFINPDMIQYATDFTRSTMEAQGKSSQQIDTAVHFQTMMMGSTTQTVLTVVFTPVIGVLEGLILAIFVKRPAPTDQVKAV